jgi:hypothetical protein
MLHEEYQPTVMIEYLTAKFLEDFLSLYQRYDITPYLHSMVHHLPEMHKKYGNLNYFSAQGLEKLNDFSTSDFFRSTNKSKEFLKQILNKDYRMMITGENIN